MKPHPLYKNSRRRSTLHAPRPTPTLTDQQRAILTLLDSAGIEGIAVDGLVLAVRSAGFEDLTRDDLLGPAGLQTLALRGLASYRGRRRGRWFVTRKGKDQLAA